MRLKKTLLLSCLSILSACASLPEQPEIVQFGIYNDIQPPGLYGVNNKTQAKVYRQFQDPRVKGAQCLLRDDFKEMQAWISKIQELASKRCK